MAWREFLGEGDSLELGKQHAGRGNEWRGEFLGEGDSLELGKQQAGRGNEWRGEFLGEGDSLELGKQQAGALGSSAAQEGTVQDYRPACA